MTASTRPRVLRVDPERPDPRALAEAARVLRVGGLVAFPTETVYGLGAHALDEGAVRRVFTAKGRPPTNPLIVHVADASAARALVRLWPPAAERLASAFWPGPLTLVLPKQPAVPDAVTAGLPTVAVRVPAHPVAQALLRAAGLPVAAPSANRFTEISPTMAEHVVRSLGTAVDLVLDAGPTAVGIESAVVDLNTDPPRMLRPGVLPPEELAAIAGVPLQPPPAPVPDDAPRASPGLHRRHYAPRTEVRLWASEHATSVAETLASLRSHGVRIGVLWHRTPLEADAVERLPDEPQGYARGLYAALHRLDAANCQLLFIEDVPATPAWLGVRDRLHRAAAPRNPRPDDALP